METVINSENALRVAAMKLLIEKLGAVNAERFINAIKSDRFDYTEWQRDLWKGKTIEELHRDAAVFYAEKQKAAN